jgi:hypothetical protein
VEVTRRLVYRWLRELTPEQQAAFDSDGPRVTGLSLLQCGVLKALLRAGAKDRTNRMSSAAIAKKISRATSDSVRQAARKLVKTGYLESQPYSQGGYWLTAKSLAEVNTFN